MTADPLDEPTAVARVLRPVCIRDDPPRHRETLAMVRRVGLALVTMAVLAAGIVSLAAQADAQATSTTWSHISELRQDARTDADRGATR